MQKICTTAVVVLTFLCQPTYGHSTGHPHYSSKNQRHSSDRSEGTVHVRGYAKKNGTYVAPYDRSAPREESLTGSTYSHLSVSEPIDITPRYREGHMAKGISPDSSVRMGWTGKIKRSGAAKDAFKREQPCPANGNTSGPCPGYVIDHVKPLECGGADDPFNMQWQTIADGKTKDKTERLCLN